MFENLPFLQKLWDKGIDIGANVITSVIVALIALAFWKGKLWLQLRSEAASRRHEKLEEKLDRHRRLSLECENFVLGALAATRNAELAHVWERYVAWLDSSQIHTLPRNLKMLSEWKLWNRGLIDTMHVNFPGNQTSMVAMIRNTELPELPERP